MRKDKGARPSVVCLPRGLPWSIASPASSAAALPARWGVGIGPLKMGTDWRIQLGSCSGSDHRDRDSARAEIELVLRCSRAQVLRCSGAQVLRALGILGLQ